MAPAITPGQYQAINDEAQLIRDLAYSGLTALRRAEFQKLGAYFEAFFAITVSLERAAKLVLALRHRLEHGSFPSGRDLADYGHDLEKLQEEVEKVVAAENLNVKWHRPSSALDNDVLGFMNKFAAAKHDRYYNLEYLGAIQSGSAFDGPPARWVSLISSHLTPRQRQLTPKEQAHVALQASIDNAGSALIWYTREDGSTISSLKEAQEHFYLCERVQKVGTLAVVHHLRFTLEILRLVGDASRPVQLPDFWDYFVLILNNDSLLKNRKTFR